MQFFTTVVLFAAAAMALPGGQQSAPYKPCPNELLKVPQCCDTDALGLVGLGCVAPPNNKPASPRAFADCCRATSRRPKCCAVTTSLEASVLCIDPEGI
ncbi:hypothetical protein V2G26_000312 [Clonostachys chloroleuca]|uniref:Cerato-ulmin n=1 Tax=Clonostachys chloroleuca TaxID=1926264 RepID=A0AA35QG64_9HYPO|nr:unnamed protein product [Clonostachys chloroleuca]